jgi:hypothetical protein
MDDISIIIVTFINNDLLHKYTGSEFTAEFCGNKAQKILLTIIFKKDRIKAIYVTIFFKITRYPFTCFPLSVLGICLEISKTVKFVKSAIFRIYEYVCAILPDD